MRETRPSGLMQGWERSAGFPASAFLPTLPSFQSRHRKMSRRPQERPSRRLPVRLIFETLGKNMIAIQAEIKATKDELKAHADSLATHGLSLSGTPQSIAIFGSRSGRGHALNS
jgi:hypothetical protein